MVDIFFLKSGTKKINSNILIKITSQTWEKYNGSNIYFCAKFGHGQHYTKCVAT
jgi:hypothetical protein